MDIECDNKKHEQKGGKYDTRKFPERICNGVNKDEIQVWGVEKANFVELYSQLNTTAFRKTHTIRWIGNATSLQCETIVNHVFQSRKITLAVSKNSGQYFTCTTLLLFFI